VKSQEKITIVFFIGTFYNKFNKFQGEAVFNDIKIIIKVCYLMSQRAYFSYFHNISWRGNLEFWRIDIRETYILFRNNFKITSNPDCVNHFTKCYRQFYHYCRGSRYHWELNFVTIVTKLKFLHLYYENRGKIHF